MTKTSSIINLIIIGIAIVLVFSIKTKYNEGFRNNRFNPYATPTIPWGPPMSDSYIQQYPQGPPRPYMQNYLPGPNFQGPGGQMGQPPLLYPYQLYPKIPYYPSVGQLCTDDDPTKGCGATGYCREGQCYMKHSDGTVFNIPVD